jgi:hypothetical protein
MRNERPQDDRKPKGLLARLDRAAEKMNAFLLVLAIGLAVLDFTCFWVLQIRNTLPPVTRVSASPSRAAQAATPAGGALVAATPSRPPGAASRLQQ